MWVFGVGFQLALFLTGKINLLACITILATLLGLLCTVAMSDGKSINGVLGFISAIGFIYVNLTAGHYSSVLDQLFFVFLIDLPIMFKWRTWGQGFKTKVRNLGLKGYSRIVPAIIIFWNGLYFIDIKIGANSPLFDSLSLAIGATASILCVNHVTQTYELWLVSDLVNIALWVSALSAGYSQASLPMLVSMILYTATSIYGRFFSDWNKKVEVK